MTSFKLIILRLAFYNFSLRLQRFLLPKNYKEIKNHKEMSQCGWLETARKFPFSHKIIRQPKRCSELARVFKNMCWKFKWEAVSDLWTPYSWRKSCRWKRGSIFLPPIPPSVSSSAATSGDFPCFNFSLHMQKIQANRIPIPFPTLSPGPPAADQF